MATMTTRSRLVAASAAVLATGMLAMPAMADGTAGKTATAVVLGGGNADGTVKLVFMLKRRTGMSREEFLHYYESHHARLGEKYVPNAIRYVRRFLDPMAGPSSSGDADYDVLTELWFANQAECDKAMKLLSDPKVRAEIQADEERLFDRAAMRMYVITERDSKMTPAPAHH
jgi:hypothetical protein